MLKKRLKSSVVPASDVTPDELQGLYSIYERHYENVSFDKFMKDFQEKDHVILLERIDSGATVGFSTQKLLECEVDGNRVRAIFSGDTIIDHEYWGEQELVKSWCRFAGTIAKNHPGIPLYWFLISKGFRTYLYLPLFFRKYYPAPDFEMPEMERRIMNFLAESKFPGYFNSKSQCIEFPRPEGNLNTTFSGIPLNRANNKYVQFFLTKNPDYAKGVELVCLAEVSEANMRSIAAKYFRDGFTSDVVGRS